MKKNESFEYEGFVVMPPQAAMDVSGGKWADVTRTVSLMKQMYDMIRDIAEFASGFIQGFRRGYNDYIR